MKEEKTKTRCSGMTEEEKPCKMTRLVDAEHCQYHSQLPEYIQWRKDLSSKGGNTPKSTSSLNMPTFKAKDAESVKKLTGKILENAARGKIELNHSTIKSLAQISKVFMDANKQVNDQRLDKLEKALANLKK